MQKRRSTLGCKDIKTPGNTKQGHQDAELINFFGKSNFTKCVLRLIYTCLFRRNGTNRQQLETFSSKSRKG
uniref:Ovule protein n=1 Tax=Romanomermis culicivorax TaxID=13658 RepID=A0A915K1B7_ROMCU